jgi:hypothetical protein
MFKLMADDIFDILDANDRNTDEEISETFCAVTCYLFQTPIWKLCAFYLYTFTFIREQKQGRTLRICMKWVRVPYTFLYKGFIRDWKRRLGW